METAHDPRNSQGILRALFESLEQWFNKTEQSYPRCSMTTSGRRGGTAPVWICSWCRGGAEDEQSLLDHQEWCLGDALKNTQMIGDVAERSGLDRAVVSRLENGKQDNPTVATLMRYAAAVAKRFLWSYENLPTKITNGDAKAGQGRTKPRS